MASDVFIPSRGRAGRAVTADLLLAGGIVPTLVVGQQEAALYAEAYPGLRIAVVEVEGIGLVRNAILGAARAAGLDRIWMLDDDIDHAYERRSGRYVQITLPEALEAMEKDIRPRVALAGPMVRQFGWSAPDHVFDRRVGIAIWLDTTGPWEYWPHFHEDTDMVLQVREAGYRTQGWGKWAISSRPMGKVPGGCFDGYQSGEGEKGGAALVERWKDRLPGVVGTFTNARGQTVSKINWARLDRMTI